MAYLSLQNVHKQFTGHRALQGINLTVDKGETLAIIGPSGCGKTTLLRCIALLDHIDEGAIYLGGKPVVTAAAGSATVHVNPDTYRTRTGFVFQSMNVWPHLTVLQNLTLAPRIVGGAPRVQAAEKAREMLHRMGLPEKVNEYPGALSGGQLQRVALARALMMDPEILLLDEITSALDPELAGEVLDVIAGLAATGITMLIVTHEMLFASEVAGRIAFMDRGQVSEVCSPSILFRPKNERLAAFLSRLGKHRLGSVS